MATEAQRAAAIASYHDNASYLEDGSATKARAFCTACLRLLEITPKMTSQGGREGQQLETSPETLEKLLDRAQRWLAVNGSTSRVKHYSFVDSRG